MRTPALLAASIAIALAACSGAETSMVNEPETPSIEPAPLDPNAPAAEQAALASCGPVTADGYCGVTFGSTPDEARAKFPVKFDTYSGGPPEQQNDVNRCFELVPQPPVQGVTFLAETNRVGRVDFTNEAGKTADGFGVGATAEAIKAKYGPAITERPNKYEPEITELTLMQGQTKFIFEIQDGSVRAWRAGLMPTIDYAEHCG